MEKQKTMNSQSKFEKENQIWKNQAPWVQMILHEHSRQNSMVLAHRTETCTDGAGQGA